MLLGGVQSSDSGSEFVDEDELNELISNPNSDKMAKSDGSDRINKEESKGKLKSKLSVGSLDKFGFSKSTKKSSSQRLSTAIGSSKKGSISKVPGLMKKSEK
jgi:hypothetical protein